MTPTRHLLVLASVLAALALPATLRPALVPLWLAVAAVAVVIAGWDFALARRRPPLVIQRDVRRSIPVGVWSEIRLELDNPGPHELHLCVHDHHPPDFEIRAMPQTLTLPAQRGARVHYRMRPGRRGDGRFPGVDVLARSPLGLWERRFFFELPSEVKVFPNFREISQYALLATDQHLARIGVRRQRRRGEGNDFHQLREYRPGDSLRQVDWKASSRMRKLISREYQDERDQQVLFLLDCGRRMRHADTGTATGGGAEGANPAGRAHIDEALNAMMLLAYVAAREGDAVGFMAFGGVRRWLPPRKSGDVVKTLLEQTYDIDATLEAADYLGAAREILPVQRRRALIVLITNSRDEDQQELAQAVQLLASRHLVVVADLRESILDEALAAPVHDLKTALRFHGVNDYLESRARAHETLRHQGALTLDLLAPQLPIALVNQYLQIKASGRL